MCKAQVSRTIQSVIQRYNFTNTEAVSKEDDHESGDHAVRLYYRIKSKIVPHVKPNVQQAND